MVIEEWSSYGDLQEVALKHPMKCRDIDLIWEGGILHWRNSKIENDSRHSPLFGWGMLMSKRLESHLLFYDRGQQEARLCWLLLKEFGHHVTYRTSRGMLWFEALHGTHMI